MDRPRICPGGECFYYMCLVLKHLFLSVVMEFRDLFDRLPEKDKRDEDRKNLVGIREKIRQLSKTKKVSDFMLE